MINSSGEDRKGHRVPGPLVGVRVLEVASYVFVPAAGAILADWGADVLKVEHPVLGDPARNTAAWGVPAKVNGVSHLWEVGNRGKRAIGLDIATPEGNEILMSLVDESDVFVTNFLPPARRKLGIDPEDIMARNPRIIYARGSAQGPAGGARRARRLRRHLVLGPDRRGHRCAPRRSHEFPSPMPGPGFGDLQSGMAMAGGIGAALYKRERTGEGVVVDVSLHVGRAVGDGHDDLGDERARRRRAALPVPRRLDQPAGQPLPHEGRPLHLPGLPPVGPVLAGVLHDRRQARLARRRALHDSADRQDNAAACVQLLDELFAERTLAEWEEILARQDGQWDVLLPAGQVRDDAQALANGYVQRVEHEGDGKVVLVPAPAQFDGEVTQLGKAPTLGSDTDDVLAAHGYDERRHRRSPHPRHHPLNGEWSARSVTVSAAGSMLALDEVHHDEYARA